MKSIFKKKFKISIFKNGLVETEGKIKIEWWIFSVSIISQADSCF